jgi:hypothetical protein
MRAAELLDSDGRPLASYVFGSSGWVSSVGRLEFDAIRSFTTSSANDWPEPQTNLAPFSNSLIASVVGNSAVVTGFGYHVSTFNETWGYYFGVVGQSNTPSQYIKKASCGKFVDKTRYDHRGEHKLTCHLISASGGNGGGSCGSSSECTWPSSTGKYPSSVVVNWSTSVKYWDRVKLVLTPPTTVTAFSTVLVQFAASKGAGQTSPVNGYSVSWQSSSDGVNWTTQGSQQSSNGNGSFQIVAGESPSTLFLRATATDIYQHTATTSIAISVEPPPPLSVVLNGPSAVFTAQANLWSASVTGGVPPYSFAWNTSQSAGPTGIDTFYQPGWYYPSVTVTDALGSVRSASIGVEASENPGGGNQFRVRTNSVPRP